jgi:hypothetical protein
MNHEEPDPGLTPILRRMRELPSEARPPFDWLEFKARAEAGRTDAFRFDWRHVAAAASVALAIGALAVWSRMVTPGSAPHAEPIAYTVPPIESRVALPREPAIVRVDTELAITDLEDSIALIDEMLTLERASSARPARVTALQRERTMLVDSLVQVRYADTLASEIN